MFNAIVESADATHKLIRDALAGCSPQLAIPEAASTEPAASVATLLWDLHCLQAFDEPPAPVDNSIAPELIQSFAAWKCPNGTSCGDLASGVCIHWHDERELRFAQVLNSASFFKIK